jgi:dienelactone hydrolase
MMNLHRDIFFVVGFVLLSLPAGWSAETALKGTAPLKWKEEDLSERLMDAAHQFVERKIGDAARKRGTFWQHDVSSEQRYTTSIEANRQELARILGVVDLRLPVEMERFSDIDTTPVLEETDLIRVVQVRWPVLEGVVGEGLLVLPKGKVTGHVVLIPDASSSPDEVVGLGIFSRGGESRAPRFVQRLAENGIEVLVPQTVSRKKMDPMDPRLKRADFTDREWIYRQAFHMGRHVIGYEIQQVLAGVHWFSSRRNEEHKIGVVGFGEGGQTAFFAAALDQRIDSALVSGYFAPRERCWEEPIYRNIWSRLNRFGDAEIASLVLPRCLVVENCNIPGAEENKGLIFAAKVEDVEAEFGRIPAGVGTPPDLVISDDRFSGYSDSATEKFAESMLPEVWRPASRAGLALRHLEEGYSHDEYRRRVTERRRRARVQLEGHVQGLVRKSEHVRDKFYLYSVQPEFEGGRWSTEREHPVRDSKKFVEASKEYRRRFYEEAIGKFDELFVKPNPRTRLVAETDAWRAYDVVLDVYDGLFAWGVLVLPKDLKPGERRPVVVCQHGRQGIPRDTIDTHSTAYNDFAAKLAERGFITFAPHNLYRGEDRYRWLDRKANTIGCTLFSFIVAQHDQTLRWLDSLPMVDGDRIAFYGLSYGGESAVRIPTIVDKYCLSICSGDFNQWTRKVAATDQTFSFMNTIEWEMPYWNLSHTFDYAEMTYLMAPRPFMVERGHHDRVGRDRWVAHEFAKVRWLYAQFGIADRVEIEFFQGGHSINGEGTFRFLHKHLNWPERSK